MGDIADDIICGFQCSGCGVCFEDEHGFPVLCVSCYRDWYLRTDSAKVPKNQRTQQATNKEL